MIMEQAFANRTFEWGVAIATLLSVLSIVPRHCARWTSFLHPKLRTINASLINPQPIPLPLRRLRRAGSVPMGHAKGPGSRGHSEFESPQTKNGWRARTRPGRVHKRAQAPASGPPKPSPSPIRSLAWASLPFPLRRACVRKKCGRLYFCSKSQNCWNFSSPTRMVLKFSARPWAVGKRK